MDEREGAISSEAGSPRSLFDTHVNAVRAYISRRIGPDQAEDVTADVFRVAFTRLDRYQPALGSERAWLLGIATNLIRHHWRSEQRRLRALERLAAEQAGGLPLGVDEHAEAAARLSDLVRRLHQLSRDDRDLILLVAWEGLSYREAAEALAVPIGTVGSRINRIRAELRAGETVHE